MAPQTGRFQPVDRLRRSVEFQHVTRRGRRVAGNAFVVICAPRGDQAASPGSIRLGVTVSRKVGNAVVRNRVKRRIREWFRGGRAALGLGIDLVVIGRSGAASLACEAANSELSVLSSAAVRQARAGRLK